MSLKVILAGLGAVAGLSYLATRMSGSRVEVYDRYYSTLPTPKTDKFEADVLELRRKIDRGDIPFKFDVGRWVKERNPFDYGNDSVSSFLMGRADSLGSILADFRGDERSTVRQELEKEVEFARRLAMQDLK